MIGGGGRFVRLRASSDEPDEGGETVWEAGVQPGDQTPWMLNVVERETSRISFRVRHREVHDGNLVTFYPSITTVVETALGDSIGLHAAVTPVGFFVEDWDTAAGGGQLHARRYLVPTASSKGLLSKGGSKGSNKGAGKSGKSIKSNKSSKGSKSSKSSNSSNSS